LKETISVWINRQAVYLGQIEESAGEISQARKHFAEALEIMSNWALRGQPGCSGGTGAQRAD